MEENTFGRRPAFTVAWAGKCNCYQGPGGAKSCSQGRKSLDHDTDYRKAPEGRQLGTGKRINLDVCRIWVPPID